MSKAHADDASINYFTLGSLLKLSRFHKTRIKANAFSNMLNQKIFPFLMLNISVFECEDTHLLFRIKMSGQMHYKNGIVSNPLCIICVSFVYPFVVKKINTKVKEGLHKGYTKGRQTYYKINVL